MLNLTKSEDSIQAEIIRFYTNTYCLKHHLPRSLIFSVPNGGTRNKMEALKLMATGLLAGVSDLILIHAPKNTMYNPVIVFLEVKTDSGRCSPPQIEFANRVNDLGFIYRVVRSLEEFKRMIEGMG